MKTQQRFKDIKPAYEKAYKEANGKDIISLTFNKGWCYLDTGHVTKVRVGKLEQMVETLLTRIEAQNREKDETAETRFYLLPPTIQKLWKFNAPIARKAEKDYVSGLVIEDGSGMEDLPKWLQELWDLNRSLAREVEKYFMNRIVSFKTHRLKSNPIEQVFHNKFIQEFLEGTSSTNVDLLVFPPADGTGSRPTEYLSEKEERVVLSTIQWLGSPVGQSFLNKCGFVKKD